MTVDIIFVLALVSMLGLLLVFTPMLVPTLRTDAIGGEFGVVLRLATRIPSLSVVRVATAVELAMHMHLAEHHMIRVSISGALSNNAHVAAHSLAVYELPEASPHTSMTGAQTDLLWRYSFAMPGRFEVNYTADFFDCNRTLREIGGTTSSESREFFLATEGYEADNVCESAPHGAEAVRAMSVVVVNGSSSSPVQRCTQPVAISDLSDGWWQSTDGLPVADSKQRLQWHLRRCTQWHKALRSEARQALAWWAQSGMNRKLYLVGDSNSGKVNSSWKDAMLELGNGIGDAAVSAVWVDVRPMAFAFKLAPSEAAGVGAHRVSPEAAKAMGYGSARWVEGYHAYVNATLSELARGGSSAFAIGPNAHFTAADGDGSDRAFGKGTCVAHWSRMDMATQLLTLSQWPQREERSSWRTAAANALMRKSTGAAYVDAFEPTLALHPWRINVVHINRHPFDKAVYQDLLPAMILVALHRRCMHGEKWVRAPLSG